MKNLNYYIVHGWMLNELHLKGNDLLTFAIIYGFSQDGESRFSGSLKYLRKSLGVSEPTVLKALKSLVEKQFISKQKKKGFCYYAVTKETLDPLKKLKLPTKETLVTTKETLDNSIVIIKDNLITPFYFGRFWKKWPPNRRGSKGKAMTSWEKLCEPKNKHRPTRQQIWIAIREQKKSEQWKDEKFIPLAATWLNNKRWLDDSKELKKYNFEGNGEADEQQLKREEDSFKSKFGFG